MPYDHKPTLANTAALHSLTVKDARRLLETLAAWERNNNDWAAIEDFKMGRAQTEDERRYRQDQKEYHERAALDAQILAVLLRDGLMFHPRVNPIVVREVQQWYK